MKRPPASLEARALGWLAQREQSRSELRRKLLRLARSRLDGADADNGSGKDREAALGGEVEQLLDRLQKLQLLSDPRFIESRVRVRAERFGVRRIASELAQHGLQLDATTQRRLADSELQRAQRLWQRRFGAPAADRSETLRQMRFLAGRGFAADVIRRVVRDGAAAHNDDLDSGQD